MNITQKKSVKFLVWKNITLFVIFPHLHLNDLNIFELNSVNDVNPGSRYFISEANFQDYLCIFGKKYIYQNCYVLFAIPAVFIIGHLGLMKIYQYTTTFQKSESTATYVVNDVPRSPCKVQCPNKNSSLHISIYLYRPRSNSLVYHQQSFKMICTYVFTIFGITLP